MPIESRRNAAQRDSFRAHSNNRKFRKWSILREVPGHITIDAPANRQRDNGVKVQTDNHLV